VIQSGFDAVDSLQLLKNALEGLLSDKGLDSPKAGARSSGAPRRTTTSNFSDHAGTGSIPFAGAQKRESFGSSTGAAPHPPRREISGSVISGSSRMTVADAPADAPDVIVWKREVIGASCGVGDVAIIVPSEADPPPRPPGMVAKGHVSDDMKMRQRVLPKHWAMTLQQWFDVLYHCCKTDKYKALKEQNKVVSMYDLTEHFVKPWTASTGCGLATLMNEKLPPEANLMFSHSWAEDVEECCAAVLDKVEQVRSEEPEFDQKKVWVWFCVFANYQCGDGAGPTIKEQLKQEPFEAVITSQAVQKEHGGHGMWAIHTCQGDLYTRLWCVHEVAAARQRDLAVLSAMSAPYVEKVVTRMNTFFHHGFNANECLKGAGISCDTIRAICGHVEDEDMLVGKILKDHGGFQPLDTVVQEFRLSTLPAAVEVQRILASIQNDAVNTDDVAKELRLLRREGVAKLPMGRDEINHAVLERLRDSHAVVRAAALEALVEISEKGSSEVCTACLERLKDESIVVRLSAVKVLKGVSEMNDQTVGVALANCVIAEENKSVRSAAIQCMKDLFDTGESCLIAALVKALPDENEGVRKEALLALRKLSKRPLSDGPVYNALLELLGDGCWFVRVATVQTMKVLIVPGDVRTESSLKELLHDEHADVRTVVSETLEVLTPR